MHTMLTPLFQVQTDNGGGGTSENVAASVTGGAAEPTSSGNVTSGSASDAMIKAAMAASSTEEATAGAEADKPATPGTPEIAAKPGAIDPQGKPGAPESRITAATRNARTAAIAETEAKYAWAKGIEPAAAEIAFDVAVELAKDPTAFAEKLASRLGMRLVPLTQAAAARTTEQGDPNEQMPTPSLRSEDGQMVYTAEQLHKALEINSRKLLAQMRGEIKPLMDGHQATQRTQAEAEAHQHATETKDFILSAARQQPHFQVDDGKGGKMDHPKILENLKAIAPAERRRLGPAGALYQAYTQYLREDVFPNIEQSVTKRVQDSWKKKAAGSGGAHPNGSDASEKPTRLRDGDVTGLAAHMARLAEAST